MKKLYGEGECCSVPQVHCCDTEKAIHAEMWNNVKLDSVDVPIPVFGTANVFIHYLIHSNHKKVVSSASRVSLESQLLSFPGFF